MLTLCTLSRIHCAVTLTSSTHTFLVLQMFQQRLPRLQHVFCCTRKSCNQNDALRFSEVPPLQVEGVHKSALHGFTGQW